MMSGRHADPLTNRCCRRQFYQRNGRPYPISNADQFRVDIRQGENAVATAVQVGASNDADSEAHQVKVSFTVRKAGQYHIGLHVSHTPIRGSPFVKNFLPGPPDGGATFIVRPSSMAVCTVGTPHQLLLEPKDEFGNACAWAHDGLQQQQKALADFTIDCHPMGSTEVVQPCVQWFWVEVMHRLLVHVTFTKEGVYVLRVQFRKETLNKGEFSMIVLSRGETSQVEKTLLTRSSSYEARLVSLNGERASKAKKVYCSLSPKQLAIKEYILGFIPKRVATFRVCPATKVRWFFFTLAAVSSFFIQLDAVGRTIVVHFDFDWNFLGLTRSPRLCHLPLDSSLPSTMNPFIN